MPFLHPLDGCSYSRGAIVLITMPKNRLISGMGGLLAQRGEGVFWLFARDLEVEGIRA
jgi:hypothetical protein